MGNFKREMEARKMKPIKMIYTKNVVSEMDTQRKLTIKMKSSYGNNPRRNTEKKIKKSSI